MTRCAYRPLAPNGKQALLGAKIWQEEINAKGGLLGRKVELVELRRPVQPGEYTGHLHQAAGRRQSRPHQRAVRHQSRRAGDSDRHAEGESSSSGLFALDGNREFHYSRYFSVIGAGPNPSEAFADGYFADGGAAEAKAADRGAGCPRTRVRPQCLPSGARENAKTYGFNVIYDKTFPPGTTDFSPVIRALPAANADLVMICSYPLSSVGIVVAANELNFTPKMLGGAMVGLQATVFKAKLKAKLNGIVNYETWVPSPKLMAPAAAFFKIYQERAKTERSRSPRLLSRRLGLRLFPVARRSG